MVVINTDSLATTFWATFRGVGAYMCVVAICGDRVSSMGALLRSALCLLSFYHALRLSLHHDALFANAPVLWMRFLGGFDLSGI